MNLGGVLLKKATLNKQAPTEALPFNQRAVQDRPEDALANAQLGMNYFKLDQFDQAEQYLLAAKRLDPAQFYQPQIFLAEIYARRGNRKAAIKELERTPAAEADSAEARDFLRWLHDDNFTFLGAVDVSFDAKGAASIDEKSRLGVMKGADTSLLDNEGGLAGLAPSALAGKNDWTVVPAEQTAESFKGDAVVGNGRIVAVLRKQDAALEVHAVKPDGAVLRQVLQPHA